MTEIVINDCYGGFGTSKECDDLVSKYYKETLKMLGNNENKIRIFNANEKERHSKSLVRAVKELDPERSSNKYSRLIVVKIFGTCYRICEYDGKEHVVEPNDLCWINVVE